MANLKVVIEPKSALVLGSGMDIKNVRTSCEFIAGSVIRGAISQVILGALGIGKNAGRDVLKDPRDRTAYENFRSVFLENDQVRFGYLYPARVDIETAFSVDTFPIPITALTCKSARGFGYQDGGHAVLDRLLPALREERFRLLCPKCEERMDQLRGFACREVGGPYTRIALPKKQFIKVGLNRWTETAEEGMLYVLEAILPREIDPESGKVKPVKFVGSWIIGDNHKSALEGLLQRFLLPEADGYKLRVGSARARGMGELVLWFRETPPSLPSVEQRLESFQSRCANGAADPNYVYFSITARSPILVLNDFGQPTMEVTGEVLSLYSAAPENIEPVSKATFVERTTLTGWSQAWALPKPVLPAIAAGSVFTFKAKRTSGKLTGEKALLDFLKSVEENGIGERRGEGLGEVIVCDPFHVDHDPEKRSVPS